MIFGVFDNISKVQYCKPYSEIFCMIHLITTDVANVTYLIINIQTFTQNTHLFASV